ncbi:unnamed protein product, partial [Ectocarpus fasciculatus]
ERSNATVQIVLAPVSGELAAKILETADIDVSGYLHAVDTQGLNHTFGRHDQDKEKRQDQMPVREETLTKFLEIVSDPRNVHGKGVTKSGLPAVVFRKRLNGHYWVVESIQTGKKRLVLHSHYIQRAEKN